ncbi:inositol monophosphatase family protein [Kordiimonas aestuarii]|uniref:inositol monophosphatase family protein n=1 Tax=Kordiimonas aestuarii TaxID=1005925 RepID=UPI0021D32A16|nr:inositol monophosphatase family protein [Kordiimonas aestuarii]
MRMRETLSQAVYNAGRDIKLEADQSLNADLVRDLQTLLTMPAFSEETGWTGGIPSEADLYWVIDPLDGSYNYWRGQPAFCIAVAVCCGRTPLFGAIYDIAHNEIYLGGENSPASCNGHPITVSGARGVDQSCLMTGLPVGGHFDSTSLSRFAHGLGRWKKVRMIGSAAMSLAYVASGRADFYHEDGIFWWDVAAGLAILKAARGDFRVSGAPDADSPLHVTAGSPDLLRATVANEECLI